jgi:hypothetical protein
VDWDRAVVIRPKGPWFYRRRRVTFSAAGFLFVGVFVVRLTVGDPGDAISMLFVLPITLLAVAFGRRAGIFAALVAVALTGCWASLSAAEISVIGWVSRIVPLLLVGGLVGDASHRLRDFEEQRRAVETSALRHRQAVEINDFLIQGMAAAKWSIEAGRVETGVEMLNETLDRGHSVVSRLMRDADHRQS